MCSLLSRVLALGVVPDTQGRGRGQRRRLRGCSSRGSPSPQASRWVSRCAYSGCQHCGALAPPPGLPATRRPSSCSRASSCSSSTRILFISRARAPSRRSTPSPAPRSIGATAGKHVGAPSGSSVGRTGRTNGPAVASAICCRLSSGKSSTILVWGVGRCEGKKHALAGPEVSSVPTQPPEPHCSPHPVIPPPHRNPLTTLSRITAYFPSLDAGVLTHPGRVRSFSPLKERESGVL